MRSSRMRSRRSSTERATCVATLGAGPEIFRLSPLAFSAGLVWEASLSVAEPAGEEFCRAKAGSDTIRQATPVQHHFEYKRISFSFSLPSIPVKDSGSRLAWHCSGDEKETPTQSFDGVHRYFVIGEFLIRVHHRCEKKVGPRALAPQNGFTFSTERGRA